jgi:CubicO group peptidase (beta-lactamase class C family)
MLRLTISLVLCLSFIHSISAQEKLPTVSLTAKVQPFVENHSLAGAVMLVANKDKTLALEAIGFADIAAQRPMTTDSIFWIASMTKPITGAAIMLLVDEGKVSLDDPVEKFLPEFKGLWVIFEQNEEKLVLQRPQRLITVRDIMNHTSGLAFQSKMEQPTLDCLPLQFQPGTKYMYSNAGINTTGRIIEVVSGMSYEDFMQKRLFEPLGMVDTSFWLTEAQVKRLAKPYKPNAEKNNLEETKISQLRYPLTEQGRYPMPGGGLFSTASDVAVFCRMVLNSGEHNGKQILSAAAVAQMTSRQTPETVKEGYGVGWSVSNNSFGHGGALATNMNIDKQRELITVWLVQHAGFPGEGGKAQGEFRKNAEELFGKR